MEKIYTKTKMRNVHKIYCDNCKKLIAEEEEFDDGYYDDRIKTIPFYMDKWYKFKKCLCDDCFKNKKEQIKEKLFECGFKEE